MKIGLSINADNFSEEFCKRMLKSGIEYAEISLCWDRTLEETKTMAEDLLKFGLKIWSIHVPFGPIPEWDPSNWVEEKRKHTVKKILPYFELALEIGACRLILHTSFEPIPEEDRTKRIEAFQYTLTELERKSKETGVLLCVENLPRTCMGNTGDEMLTLVKNHPDIYICCDMNHMLLESTEEFLLKCRSKIKTVHISDYDGIDERHWLPGQGITNWKRVSELLQDYDGVYMMELKEHRNGMMYTPEEAANAIQLAMFC